MLKRILCILLIGIMVFTFAACGQKNNADESTEGQEVSDKTSEAASGDIAEVGNDAAAADGGVLVVYFSWSGNTKEMASYIAEQTGGDLLEIEPETPYSEDYDEVGDVAKKERDDNARPGIANLPDSLDKYDTILIGYPIWWHTAPMIIGTFLENYDLSGKEIYPFTQSASMDTEQFENSMDFVRESAGSGNVHDGLFAEATDTDEILSYLKENNLQSTLGSEQEKANNNTNALVVYFSVPDNKDNSYVEKDGEQLGNTQYMAYVIQENMRADIFRIQPTDPYPTDHEALLERAQEEIQKNARPQIDGEIGEFDSYDVVFVGYPTWNADMPNILYTFFENYDFSGKTIVLFNTHGGSGFAGTEDTIAELEPDATVVEGMSIYRDDIEDAEQDIIDWVDGLGPSSNYHRRFEITEKNSHCL